MVSVTPSLRPPTARHPIPPAGHDRLAPGARNAVIGAIVVLHLAGGWAALQVPAVRRTLAEAAPLFVDLIQRAPPAPAPPASPAPPRPAPRPPLRKPPTPAPQVAAPPATAPAPAPVQSAVPAPAQDPDPAPTPLAAAPALPAPPASVPAAPAAPDAPREIPPSAVDYLVLPDIAYPAVSRRLRESGLVVVAALVGPDGVPRQVQLQQSSGHARLDDAAIAGVRRARFKPYTEGGRAVSGWARIPIPFELEP